MIPFMRDLIFKDFWLKLFSLALAVLIWLTVYFFAKDREGAPIARGLPILPEPRRVYRELPVMVMSSAADVRSFRVIPSTVHVTVEGDAKRLDGIPERDIHVIVDLTGIEAAKGLRKRIEVSTPAGIRLVAVDPPEVEVIFPAQ